MAQTGTPQRVMTEEELAAIEALAEALGGHSGLGAGLLKVVAEVRKLRLLQAMAQDGLAQMEAALVAQGAELERMRAFIEGLLEDADAPGEWGACVSCGRERRGTPHDADCELVALLGREPKP